jgi:hypothetical protein
MRLVRIAMVALLTGASATAWAQDRTGQQSAPVAPGFSDTSIGYTFGPSFAEPAVSSRNYPRGLEIQKNILNVRHVDGGTLWSNFLNIDILISNGRDPANNSAHGAVEMYGIYRGDLSLNTLTHSQMFAINPIIRDVSIGVGLDLNTKNTSFAPAKSLITFGPEIQFNVPGFLNVAFQLAHEWNNNGIVHRNVNFNPTWEIEAVWMTPLTFTGLPLRFEGFLNVVGPKGRDGFNARTRTELLTEPRLTLDVGALVYDRPNRVDVSLGVQYWVNKFGNDHHYVPGSIALTPLLSLRYHF